MKRISIDQLKEKLDKKLNDFFLIDVRDLEEYNEAHIPGSLHVPWDVITERIQGIKPDREIIVYCNTGIRGGKAAKSLDDAGFKNVLLFKGGMEEWRNH